MRKMLTVAASATATLALAAGAAAQVSTPSGDATLDVSASPSDAGTARNPKNTKLGFKMVVNKPLTTVEKITVSLPRGLKFSGKGFKRCSEAILDTTGRTGCPRGSSAGPRGQARALVGPASSPAKAPLNFNVYPFVQDSNTFLFYLAQYGDTRDQEAGVQRTIKGEIRAKGRRITITIPEDLRKPGGLDASLVDLAQTFKGKVGKGSKAKYIVTSIGCRRGSYKTSGTLTFSDRVDGTPTPPPLVMNGAADCRK